MTLLPLIRTCFRSSRSQPVRTGLMILGIALGVAGVVSIDMAKTSVSRSFELSTAALTVRATHQITGSDLSLPQDLFTRLRTHAGIYKSAPVISRVVKVAQLGGRPLTLMGIDPFSETHFRDFKLMESDQAGAVRQAMIQGKGVIMARGLAQAHGLAQGDPLTLVLGQRKVGTRIGAFVESPPGGGMAEGLLIADIALAQDLLEMKDRISRIDLALDSKAEERAVTTLLGPGQFLVDTDLQNQTVRGLSRSFETSLTAFSALVLFMGIFLIYNTVSFSVARRQRLFGTFRALGATRQEIFWAQEAEVMTYALAGAVLGLFLGIALGKGAVQVVCATVSDIYFTLTVNQTHISPATLVKGLVTGLGASLVSSLAPAVNAANTVPVTLMQPSSAQSRLSRHLPWLAWAGLALLGTAFGIFSQEGAGMGWIFFAVFLLFGAASLLSPLMITGVTLAASALLRMGQGKGQAVGRHRVMAGMAVRNVRRSLSRTSVLIASLMVVISVYIGIDTMTVSFRDSISRWVDSHIGGDVHIAAMDALHPGLDPSLLLKIEAMAEVVQVSAYNIHKSFSKRSGEVHIFSYITDTSQKDWTWLDPGAGQGAKVPRLLDQGWIVISEILARQHGLSPRTMGRKEHHVVMETVKGPVSFRVAGVFQDFFMGGGRAVVSRNTMKTFWGKEEITAMQVFLSNHADPLAIERTMARIQGAVSDPESLKIESGPRIKAQILAVFDNTFLITSALQVLTALVALTGIINAVMALILERTRELGVLRALGAEPIHIRLMVLWECTACGLIAGLLALPLGLLLSWVLIDVVNFRAFGWTYEVRVSFLTLATALGFSSLAALMAGLVPAVQAGRVAVLDALRTE